MSHFEPPSGPRSAPSLGLVDALGVAAVLVDRPRAPAARLRRALVAVVSEVLGEFYARLAAVPEFAALLGDGSRIARLRREQERYWRLLLERPLDGGRVAVVRHVAEVHWRLAIEPGVLALAYGFVAERLAERASLSAEARFEVLRWLGRVVRVDLALALDTLWRLQLDESQAIQRELERKAATDPLTGLANRRLLVDELERAVRLADRHGRAVGLLRIDVDHFKDINDAFGHDAGDRVLRKIAGRLARAVRGGDLAARVGGDEFALLVRHPQGEAELARLADRLVTVLGQPVTLGRRRVEVGTSIGYALLPDHAETAEGLLQTADEALYEAKRHGRRRAVGARARGAVPSVAVWLERFAAALVDGRVHFRYQPQVAIDDGRLRGFEALVRWRCDDGELGPDRFVERVVRSVLVAEFTDWSLDRAAAFAARLHRELGFAGPVAVNLAHRQFHLPDLPARVKAVLARHRLPPAMLELEITEEVLLAEDERRLLATLDALGDLGVRLALDDFGTGWASLSYLERLPVRTLKIDAGFVRRLDRSPRSRLIVRSLCRLARALEAETVAEGVELPAQLEALRGWRCEVAQGYLFARPLAEPEALAFARGRLARAAPRATASHTGTSTVAAAIR